MDDLVDEHLRAMRARLDAGGMAGRVGFGSRPALLVVDLVRGFTDPSSPLGHEMSAVIETTRALIDACTGPVLYSVPVAEAGLWSRKIPSNDMLVPGSEWTAIDPRVAPRDGDLVFQKSYPSCFFGTDLVSRLVARSVDTLVLAGCSTSGCIRATAVDACSLGLHTIVVGDAVADRAPLSHKVALFDIDAKYGDVVSAAEAVARLA
jgi:nicotinamidase-related amidase